LKRDDSYYSYTETVWQAYESNGATGGGYSMFFESPAQYTPFVQEYEGINAPYAPQTTTARGVPDVSALADPYTGLYIYCQVNIGGELYPAQWIQIGGTSLASPIWASYWVAKGRKEFAGKYLYTAAGIASLNDITVGNNSFIGGVSYYYTNDEAYYQATVGWDPCTGLGSPRGGRADQQGE